MSAGNILPFSRKEIMGVWRQEQKRKKQIEESQHSHSKWGFRSSKLKRFIRKAGGHRGIWKNKSGMFFFFLLQKRVMVKKSKRFLFEKEKGSPFASWKKRRKERSVPQQLNCLIFSSLYMEVVLQCRWPVCYLTLHSKLVPLFGSCTKWFEVICQVKYVTDYR